MTDVSGSWQISADTGGTFTDCFARRPDGGLSRCKLLSSGCLRFRLIGRDVVDGVCRLKVAGGGRIAGGEGGFFQRLAGAAAGGGRG